jgi:hypothetical protein
MLNRTNRHVSLTETGWPNGLSGLTQKILMDCVRLRGDGSIAIATTTIMRSKSGYLTGELLQDQRVRCQVVDQPCQ